MDVPSFHPTDLASCVLCLEAGSIVGLVDGDEISSVSDQSSAANDASKSTTGPRYKVNMFGSYPGMRFDQVQPGKLALTSELAFDTNKSCTIFILLKPLVDMTTSSGSYNILMSSAGTSSIGLGGDATAFFTNETIWCYNWDGVSVRGTSVNSVTLTTDTQYLLTLNFNAAGPTTTYRLNKVSATSSDGSAGGLTSTYYLNTMDTIGNLAGNKGNYVLGGIWAFNDTLSAADVSAVETYITNLTMTGTDEFPVSILPEGASDPVVVIYAAEEEVRVSSRPEDGVALTYIEEVELAVSSLIAETSALGVVEAVEFSVSANVEEECSIEVRADDEVDITITVEDLTNTPFSDETEIGVTISPEWVELMVFVSRDYPIYSRQTIEPLASVGYAESVELPLSSTIIPTSRSS